VFDEPLSYDLREKMRGCGWTIEGTWEESESVGSYDDEDDDYWWDNYYNEGAREDNVDGWRTTILIKISNITFSPETRV
jgi:hypothetical protein